MRSTKLYTAFLSLLLLCAEFSFAQPTVSVSASTDKSEILIGQQIKLSLDVKISLGFNPSWFPLDSIPHFEFIEKGKIDSVVTQDDKTYHQDIIITSFDSGVHVIPRLPVIIGGKNFLTDSIPITVKLSPLDPKQDYHDIKDIIDVQNPYSKYILWAIVATTVICLALFVYFITRKQKLIIKENNEPVSRLTAYDEAMKSLEELKKQNLPEKGQVKLYYSRLNDILRLFVLRRLQMATMTKTNEELIMQLKDLNISRDQFTQMAQALRISDFVKFAKYLPTENDNEENFKTIRSSVELLNEIDN